MSPLDRPPRHQISLRTSPEALRACSGDATENPEVAPAAVVDVQRLDDLIEVVTAAAREGIPLTPRVAGTNLGGLAIPARGGWVVDLSKMNRICEIDQDNMIAVVEPGVSFGQLGDALARCQPRLTIGFPLSPPEASVAANCLLDGLGNLSLKHGAMGDWVTGLEAVRGDGTVLRTGAWALGVPVPFARAPLPDLTGLFLSWQGTTGIVSKLAVQLWPDQPFRERSFVLARDRRSAIAALRALPRLDVLDDLGGLSWPVARMLFGVHHPRERDPQEPEFFLYLDLAAATRRLLRAKQDAVRGLLGSLRRQGLRLGEPIDVDALVRLEPRLAPFAEFPTRLDFLLDHPDGGLTWVGTYGPMSRLERAFDRGADIVARHGFPPTVVTRPMKGAHFGVLRFIQTFQREVPADRERVRACNAALCDALVEEGFVMYKTPAWAVERYRDRLDPGFRRLMGELRHSLDPAGIMNPGRWKL